MSAGNQKVKLIAERVPEELPWGELGVDIVIESTGIFRMKSQLESHLNAGAKKVILTVPARMKLTIQSFLGLTMEVLSLSIVLSPMLVARQTA